MISFLKEKWKRCTISRIMGGYEYLKHSHSLDRIPELKQFLTIQKLEIDKKFFSKWIFGAGIDHAEIVCRQYLLSRVAGLNLNKALLYAQGKSGSPVVYYLPPEWRRIIQNHGFKVASFRAMLLWNALIGLMLVSGILKIAKIIFKGIKASFCQSNRQLGSYVYFNDLAANNLPQPCKDGRSHDIISWYMQWPGRIGNIDTLCHGVSGTEPRAVNETLVIPVQDPIPLPSLGRYISWGIVAVMIATVDFLRGHWWHALLLNQAALAAQVRFQNPDRLAKDYLFHNSNWIYRPLWTYETEKNGARVIFYFYSTQCERLKRLGGYPPPEYGFQAMNWPHYLVWDEFQADFVRRVIVNNAVISIVGHIYFSDSEKNVPPFTGKGIAVFDVTPYHPERHQTCDDFVYYVPEICNAFLRDIQKVAEKNGWKMLWKRKRKLNNETEVVHPDYIAFERNISYNKNVIIVDPGIAASRLIESCACAISIPFTSTGVIAKELGKPSCYYDPLGLIQKDDRSAHGVEIISGPAELIAWLEKLSFPLSDAKASGRRLH
ncbi:MAG: polysaccharide biosynthesis PFTS motif protein [Desulfamplus sp.]|nr:polysaccharide biosynthesis PFTS motif protein [Desulfamplus sp.]